MYIFPSFKPKFECFLIDEMNKKVDEKFSDTKLNFDEQPVLKMQIQTSIAFAFGKNKYSQHCKQLETVENRINDQISRGILFPRIF